MSFMLRNVCSLLYLFAVVQPLAAQGGGSPPQDTTLSAAQTVRVMVIGDWGTRGKGQKKVAAAMASEHRRKPAAAVLSTGDNIYNSGVRSTEDKLWESTFENVYDAEALPIPFWCVLGNHDYRSSPDAQVEYTGKVLRDGSVTRWNMPGRYWFTDLRSRDSSLTARVIGIDTQQLVAGKAGRDRHLKWLEDVLRETVADWIFVVGHHPVYSHGHYGNNRTLIRHLAPVLVRHGVHAYMNGHEHDLQMLGPVEGVYYVVSGAAGSPRKTSKGSNSLFAAGELGFVTLDATPESASVRFLDTAGKELFRHVIPRTR